MRLAVIAFALGICVLQQSETLPENPAWFLGGLLPVIVLGWRWPRWRWLLLPLLVLLGFFYAAWRAELRLSESLPAAWQGQDIEIMGVVSGLPQDFGDGSRFEFSVEKVLTPGAVVPEHLLLSLYQARGEWLAPPQIHAGERWLFTVRLKLPHGNANPGAFDYEAWLLERGIRATGYVRPGALVREQAFVWRMDTLIESLREAVRERFVALLPPADYPYGGILTALVIGDQKAIQGELWQVFNRTGVTHLMSISGLHVTLVAGLLGMLLGRVWRRVPALSLRCPAQQASLLAACLGGLLYAALAGFAVPAQRTLYMLLVAAVAMLSGRRFAPSRVLVLALLVVLLIDPWAVLAAGFWLSFSAVAALLFATDGRLLALPGWRQTLSNWGWVQWAATVASLPVLLLLFQQFSLVSPLANALAIPWVSFLITPLALLLAILPWPPLAWFTHGLLSLLMSFLGWCATWPVWQSPAPPLWAVGVAAIGVLLALLPRGMPGRLLGLCLLAPILAWPPNRPEAGGAWIDVLDVGQGLAVVLQTQQHALVYDPGPLYSAETDAGQRVLVPYLRWLGINRLDAMIVTHRDSDHSGGARSVLAAMPVDDLLTSWPTGAGRPCVAGQHWQWDGVDFTVLHPLAGAPAMKSNHLSCVLRISTAVAQVLLTSDIEAEDEAELLARVPELLPAQVLLVPHHGSATSSTPAFLQAVGAHEAIVPVGYRNRFGHPKAAVMARYQAMGARIWRTDQDGAVSIQLHAGGLELSAWRKQHQRYWYGR